MFKFKDVLAELADFVKTTKISFFKGIYSQPSNMLTLYLNFSGFSA